MKCLKLVVCVSMGLAAHAAFAGNPQFCNAAAITIDAGAAAPAVPYPSPTVVSGLGSSITTFEMQLVGLSHTFPDDLDFLLVGPTGASLVVQSDSGLGDDVVGLNITYSDSAAAALPDGNPLVAGTFRPTNYGAGDAFAAPAPVGPYGEPAPAGAATLASVFAGTDPNGTWNLYVIDDAGVDGGSISGGLVACHLVRHRSRFSSSISNELALHGFAKKPACPGFFVLERDGPGFIRQRD